MSSLVPSTARRCRSRSIITSRAVLKAPAPRLPMRASMAARSRAVLVVESSSDPCGCVRTQVETHLSPSPPLHQIVLDGNRVLGLVLENPIRTRQGNLKHRQLACGSWSSCPRVASATLRWQTVDLQADCISGTKPCWSFATRLDGMRARSLECPDQSLRGQQARQGFKL